MVNAAALQKQVQPKAETLPNLTRHMEDKMLVPRKSFVSNSGAPANENKDVMPVVQAPEVHNADTLGNSTMAGPLDSRLTFDRFRVGASNSIAYAAARNIVEGSDDRLIYIHGGSGRGKSHLLCAIAHEWIARRPQDNVLYLTYDNMLTGYVRAVMSKSIPELRAYLDKIDIVLIDDVHLLRGRKATQEELLCFIDRVTARGKIAVVAGGMNPSKLAETGINQRLTDRMAGGLCVSVKLPEYEVRLQILRQMADHYESLGEARVPDTHLEAMARRCDNSVRELEGAFRIVRLNMTAANEAGMAPLDEENIKAILQEHLKRHRKEITLDLIKEKTADEFGVTVLEMESRRRIKAIANARHAYCLVARRKTDAPLKQIGAVINRDHTTVMSSIERGEALAACDPEFADRISRLLEMLE